MGDIEKGKCDICGNESQLSRKYYYYDINCQCHGPKHFEIVRHCRSCKPKPPETTTVYINPTEDR